MADYKTKSDTLKKLEEVIDVKTEELNQVKAHIEKEKEKATKEIQAIVKKKQAAEDNFLKKKANLDSQFKKALAEHKLNFEKIKKCLHDPRAQSFRGQPQPG